jgi:hypothetical protein
VSADCNLGEIRSLFEVLHPQEELHEASEALLMRRINAQDLSHASAVQASGNCRALACVSALQ